MFLVNLSIKSSNQIKKMNFPEKIKSLENYLIINGAFIKHNGEIVKAKILGLDWVDQLHYSSREWFMYYEMDDQEFVCEIWLYNKRNWKKEIVLLQPIENYIILQHKELELALNFNL